MNEGLSETYHSVHGALQESLHVFIKNGLEHVVQGISKPISIFEVGFGTGLNTLLTLQFSTQHQTKIHYTSIEASPLTEEIWSKLNYASMLDFETEFKNIHTAEWGVTQPISADFNLLKLNITLQRLEFSAGEFDLIYYDAFAPSKQPELWTFAILEKVVLGLKQGGVFVTYCAKGQLKRDLARLGLKVETLPGPPGKKEMVRAVKP